VEHPAVDAGAATWRERPDAARRVVEPGADRQRRGPLLQPTEHYARWPGSPKGPRSAPATLLRHFPAERDLFEAVRLGRREKSAEAVAAAKLRDSGCEDDASGEVAGGLPAVRFRGVVQGVDVVYRCRQEAVAGDGQELGEPFGVGVDGQDVEGDVAFGSKSSGRVDVGRNRGDIPAAVPDSVGSVAGTASP
jgi:hypothetical protein